MHIKPIVFWKAKDGLGESQQAKSCEVVEEEQNVMCFRCELYGFPQWTVHLLVFSWTMLYRVIEKDGRDLKPL